MSVWVAAFLAATLAARLFALFATGFCDDEAYVVAISRAPALSYFDHPPLHQWMLWAWSRAFGEGHAARLPFFACTLLTTLGLWGLTRRLFGAAAAAWSVFAFSASAYFLVYPDGYILPDAPLFAALTLGVWAVAEILFGPPGRETPLWLAAGLAFGLAGLAKYSAIFAPLGLAGYFAASPAARARLGDWRPYAAAALAVAMLTPVVIWNARHGWISLGFQTGRAARGLSLSPKASAQILAALGAQLAALTPWIAWPMLAGIASALRTRSPSMGEGESRRAFGMGPPLTLTLSHKGRGDSARFLLWQALPPLFVFAAMPLMGVEPIAHWFNSGWLFAFPLAGAWLAARGVLFQRRFFVAAASLAAVVFALYLGAVLRGPLPLARDPTRQMFDWPAAPLREAVAKSGATFVGVENWRVGGRVGVALGPDIPVCALGGDPRGFAFACDARRHPGETALIVREHGHAQATQASGSFAEVVPLGQIAFGRNGTSERALDLEEGRNLTSAPPLPYGP